MSLKNFKTVSGIDIDSYTFPVSVIQKTVKSNSITTIDTLDISSFLAVDAMIHITQGSKRRTSSVLMQTNGSSVDITEYGIIETGGTISGVAITASVSGTDVLLRCTITDAASTPARVKVIKNTNLPYTLEVPDAPTIDSVTSVVGGVTVAFTAPTNNGQSAITGYTVISNPGFVKVDGTSSPITVTGLDAGVDYVFNVRAVNSVGYGPLSSDSSSAQIIVPPVLSGGTLASDSTYYYRTFTASDTLSIANSSISMDYVIIAGGGSGEPGWWYNNSLLGAGGGAGGVISSSGTFQIGNYPITVGGGGTAGYRPYSPVNGSDSTFNSLTAIGGGGGGSAGAYNGGNGGSGGGLNGQGTPGQGYNGGTGGSQVAPGGGGAGGAGKNSPNSYYYPDNITYSGVGGAGINLSAWATATSTGVNGYYAGGGGGVTDWGGSGYAYALGGSGGGGNGGATYGSPRPHGQAGVVNTGSGGGGGCVLAGTSYGGGGSGIVMVRYLKSAV